VPEAATLEETAMVGRFVLMGLLVATFAVPAMADTDTGERKNFQVLRDVAKEVRQYSRFTVFDDVSAAIDNGVVTLMGKVTMPFKREEIAARVARVEGVREVRNELGVLPVSPFDDELRFRIARAIYSNAAFWHYAAMANPPIHIVVEHGRVTLTGVVNNNVERMLARSLATDFGAFSVNNNLKTDAEMDVALERIRD
jgi:hyperosmotically inducible protein